MCLMGGEQVAKHIAQGTLPTSPMAVATAPIFDPDLDQLVADEVVTDLAARISGKNIALAIVKRVPLMGGGVSAVMDGFAPNQIGRYATGELVRRRGRARDKLKAARASRFDSAAVVARRGKNASALSPSVRRRAIADARSC